MARPSSTRVLNVALAGLFIGGCAGKTAEPGEVPSSTPAPADATPDASPATPQASAPLLVPTDPTYAEAGQGYRCGAAAGAPAEMPRQLEVDHKAVIVDPKSCEPGQGTVALPLGSISVEVTGLKGKACAFEVTSEIEGGYSVYACQARKKKGALKIDQAYDLTACELLRSGNEHGEMAAALAKQVPGYPIEGTSYTVGVKVHQPGNGPSVVDAERIVLGWSLYQDKRFETPLQGAETSGQLEFRWSDDGLGTGLRAALQAHPDAITDAMHQGEVRSVIVREEVAQGLRERLPPIEREAQICVRLEVLEVE